MQKTKIGISVGLYGASLYFLGLISIFPLVIMAGYALLYEENEWLKKTAIKAVAVVIFFNILSSLVGIVGNSSSLLNEFVGLFGGSFSISILNRIISICRNLVSLSQTVFLLMLGFKALKQGDVKLSHVDKTINQHI